MSRIAIVTLVVFASTSIVAQTAPAPTPAAQPAAADASKSQPPDPGVRKLSRRERKERVAKLSDEWRQFLADVEPIMTPTELHTFLVLETDAQREIYANEFWKRRDAIQGTTGGAFRDLYYERLEYAKEKFKNAASDRSRMYLIHGEPTDVMATDCDRLLQPIEVWQYYYLPSFGHQVRFLFYKPRQQNDYRLWNPMGDRERSLADLVSEQAMGSALGEQEAVNSVFKQSASPYTWISKIETACKNGDQILRAIYQAEQNKTLLLTLFEPPKLPEEDVRKILRSVVLANPDAPKLAAEYSVKFPAKQGARTDAEITLLVPRAQLKKNTIGNSEMYSIDVTGEVLRDGKLYENYRYRYDFPGDVTDEKLPVVIDRFLRPDTYTSRIKVTDVNSGAESIVENELKVPEIFDTPEQVRQKESAAQAISQLKDQIESNETRLRIVPMPDEIVSGIQKIETIAVGSDIKAVEFWLDGKKIAIKRQPPFNLELDFGEVPQVRRVRALALDARGEVLTGDDIVVNTGTEAFRVRIASPRVANKVRGRTRVEVEVRTPEGKAVEAVELYLNEARLATMYDKPYVQTITIPETQGVGYIRAVARLKDDPAPPAEDMVMINTPQFMEEVNVHLVELPTTVLVNGRPANDLGKDAFKVLDEGKPVKISKFEHVRNLPLSIGLAIDTSGSMQPRMNEAQRAAGHFFQNVMKQGDRAFLVAFDSQPQLVQKWSPKVADVHAGLAKLRAEEYTALYDAVVYSLYNFAGVKGQKALVLLSDGKDTASKFSFEQALEYARRAAVPIYTIGIGIRSTDIDVRYKLAKLTGETGGAAYYIERAEDLRKIYDDIQNELRSQYVLGFYPPEGVKPGGKWREVTVQVAEGKAKTIRGYYP